MHQTAEYKDCERAWKGNGRCEGAAELLIRVEERFYGGENEPGSAPFESRCLTSEQTFRGPRNAVTTRYCA